MESVEDGVICGRIVRLENRGPSSRGLENVQIGPVNERIERRRRDVEINKDASWKKATKGTMDKRQAQFGRARIKNDSRESKVAARKRRGRENKGRRGEEAENGCRDGQTKASQGWEEELRNRFLSFASASSIVATVALTGRTFSLGATAAVHSHSRYRGQVQVPAAAAVAPYKV